LDTAEEMQTAGFGLYWAESARQIPYKGDLIAYWIRISSARDFLGTPPSYTLFKDPMLRLCHRLIACSITRRSQALEKVTVTDLFYLRGIDVDSVNVPYLLARELPIIDMAELVRLQICKEIDDTRSWVAPRLEKQPDTAAGAPEAVEDALVIDEGAPAIPAPVQAPQPPQAARTMPQRMDRLEEDIREIRGALVEQREVINAMARDFSKFTVWAARGIAQLLDFARVTYVPYSETHIPYL
ncbi:hypothetical protein Tco_1566198, partial [Tanacetum coccineum]